MELTPQLLETQQFPEKWRGYDQDAVDEFLERVGVAVAELQDRLRTATDRVAALESKPAQAAPVEAAVAATPTPAAEPSEAQQVARALILAQEAADKAVAEANAEAESIVAAATDRGDSALADAKARAETIVAEANDEATRLRSDAAAEAKRLTSEAEERHSLATAKLDDADAHVAELAQGALAEARTEAERLTSEAAAEADRVTSAARTEADRLVSEAEARAAADVAAANAEGAERLAVLEREIAAQQERSAALSIELTERETALREVVDQLGSIVGRVGDLAGSQEQATDSRPSLTVVESPAETAPGAGLLAAVPSDDTVVDLTDGVTEAEVPDSVDVDSDQSEAVVAEPGAPVAETKVATAEEQDSTTTAPLAEDIVVPDTAEALDDLVATASADVAGTVVESAATSDTTDAVVSAAAEATAPEDTAIDHTAIDDTAIDDTAVAETTIDDTVASSGTVSTESTNDLVIDLTESAVEVDNAVDVDSDLSDVDELWASTPASSAVVDDPFLAALRGSDRVEFDGAGEPEDRGGFRRRRRTRRLT